MKTAGGGKSVKAAQMACASENAEERLFKGVQLVNHMASLAYMQASFSLH